MKPMLDEVLLDNVLMCTRSKSLGSSGCEPGTWTLQAADRSCGQPCALRTWITSTCCTESESVW